MARKRLTAIAGALGLVAWLATSGVTAQADTSPGPDLTYYSLLATYSWSNQDTCFSNNGGVSHPSAGSCTITQTSSTKRNIAVCVQSSTAAGASQECDITQTNGSANNYALVIQKINQQGAGTSCPAPPIPPCQMATQRASIGQANPLSSGSNFAGVFQTINQSLSPGNEDDPSQTNSQRLASLTPTPPNPPTPGLQQSSGTGSNFAAVGQSSRQSQTGGASQDQTATQFAGVTESGQGVNQMTGAPGGNAAVLGQVQKQDLQTAAASSAQTQHAFQDGDITQDDGAASKNFASGNQFQDQREQGVSTTTQHQFGDPKCCSTQNGGNFRVTQASTQLQIIGGALNSSPDQDETLIGNCNSSPNGSCRVHQSVTQQNGTPHTNDCPPPGQPSTTTCLGATIHCTTGVEGGCVIVPGGGSFGLVIRSSRLI